MFIGRHLDLIEFPKPQSFAGLMELYEQNYIRFRQLCPDLARISHHAVSHISDEMDLHVYILDRSRFTTTVLLTYVFTDHDRQVHYNPDVKVRIYHDALQAEALSCRYQDKRWARESADALRCKWTLNRFLYKWLSYCRRQGHDFSLQSSAAQSSIESS